MSKIQFDLTEGRILNKLLIISGPIMATQLFQMAYNLIDMFFVGSISYEAVAATGAAGMFMWLSVAFFVIGSMGASIGVSQNKGRGDMATAKKFAQNSLLVALILGLVYAVIVIIKAPTFISWLGIREEHVIADAALYLRIIALSFPMLFANNAITGAFNGSGNSGFPFKLKMIGLVINVIISPILIFSLNMGIMGAAIATGCGYIITGLLLIFAMKSKKYSPFDGFSFVEIFKPDKTIIKQIFKWTLPVAIENASFTILTMVVTNFTASFGAVAIATKQIGVQMVSMTFLIAGGYAQAFTSFVGQNYGAGKMQRIKKGFNISIGLMISWGSIVTLVLVVFGASFYRLFTSNPLIIASGVRYLRIVAFVQIITCIEMLCTGTFRGFGKTTPPLIASVTFNTLRIFIAFGLSQTPLGLYGVFIGEAIGVFLRGSTIYIWYSIFSRRFLKKQEVCA